MSSVFNYIKAWILKFFRGAKLSLIGLQAYYYYPRLLMFPFMQGIFCSLGFIAIAVIIVALSKTFKGLSLGITPDSHFKTIIEYTRVMLIIYAVQFSHVLLQIGACHTTAAYCDGKKMGFFSALYTALRQIKNIIIWTAIATMAFALSGRRSESSSASILGFIAHTTWTMLTFFLYPVIAFSNLGMLTSLKKSVDITKTNFTTTAGLTAAFKAFHHFISYVVVGLFSLTAIIGEAAIKLFPSYFNEPITTLTPLIFMVCVAITWLALIIAVPLEFMFTAQNVVATIIYRHLHNQSTGVFSHQQLEEALTVAQQTSPS